MKNKYQRLSKEEQMEALEKFKSVKADRYKAMIKLRRVSIFAIAYALISFLVDKAIIPYYENKLEIQLSDPKLVIPTLIINCFMLVLGVAVLFFVKSTLEKQINDMLVSELHEKQKQAWAQEQKKNKNVKIKKETKVKKEKVKKNGKTTKSNS